VRFLRGASSASARIAVYDVAGARRWSASLESGRTELAWNGVDDAGRPLAAGIYFARMTQEGRVVQARIIRLQ
jgi:hypothetical protein